ncbi:MAG: VWA domain-containing protein [Kiritimatiellales bacterium]|nr:VWA domain-containing protein [Kiritimatiellales bacterium]
MKWGAQDMLWWLLALLPLMGLTGLMIRHRENLLAKMADRTVWQALMPNRSVKRRRTKNLLRTAAIALVLLALARPQWGFHWEEVKQRGLNIIVALDTSKSMLAQDIKPNRLQQAKWGIQDLVKQLKGDRIGMVAFAGGSFLQCPVTIDYAAFMMMLDDVYAGIIPRGGTDIHQALKTSMESFDTESAADKVIILISDGEGHTGDPLQLVPKLKEQGIRVFAIGVGTLEGELIQGKEGFIKDSKGDAVMSHLTEGVLEQIASQTGGFYVRSASGDFGLERVYKQGIAPLQRDEQESRMAKIYQERFPWFIGAALLLLLIEVGIRPVRTPRKAALLLVLLLPFSARAEQSPRELMKQGLKHYEKGSYSNALQALEKTAADFPDIGNYNLGNTLYRLKNFQGSEEAFKQALRTTDLDLQAKTYYNRGNALLAQTTQLADPQQIDQAIEMTRNAADMYEKAIQMDAVDMDAKRNYEKALKLLEKLEEQKKQQQEQQEQEQQKQDQDKEQEKKENKQDQQQDQKQDDQQQNKPDDQQQDQQEQDQDQQQQQPEDLNDEQKQDNQSSAQPQTAEQMTPEEAQQLMDAMKQEEQNKRAELHPVLGAPVKVDKDW